ncbi:hypothetical protein RFI_39735, partial [Reticulomyxa filosa]
ALNTNKICIITALVNTKRMIEAMRHLSPYKAQGPDNIHNQMLKNGGNAMIESLVFLFGWSFRMGYMSIAWKKANIAHIPKPNKSFDCNSVTYAVIHQLIQCGMFADDVALWTSIFTSDVDEMSDQLRSLQQSLDE